VAAAAICLGLREARGKQGTKQGTDAAAVGVAPRATQEGTSTVLLQTSPLR
jgi:hypothetical protein